MAITKRELISRLSKATRDARLANPSGLAKDATVESMRHQGIADGLESLLEYHFVWNVKA